MNWAEMQKRLRFAPINLQGVAVFLIIFNGAAIWIAYLLGQNLFDSPNYPWAVAIYLFSLALFDVGFMVLNYYFGPEWWYKTYYKPHGPQPQSPDGPIQLPADVETVKSGNVEINLPVYDIADVPLNLDSAPHFLIAGATGTGKSNLMRNLLPRITGQGPTKFAIIDTGGLDYGNITAESPDQVAQVLDAAYFITRGLTKDLQAHLQNGGNRVAMLKAARELPRVIVLWEEMESGLTLLEALPKTALKRAQQQLLYITATARKTRVHFMGIVQKGDATTIPTKVRDNMHNLWLTKVNQNVSQLQFKVPHDLSKLPLGLVYSQSNDALVKVPLVETVPPMEVLTLDKLQGWAKYYVEKYSLTFGLESDTVDYADTTT